jgi:hypothetical protein
MLKSTTLLGAFVLTIVLSLANFATATTIGFSTPGGTILSGGQPVDAQATFVTSANTITITLDNLQTNIKDITQVISGVSFALDDLKTGTTILSSLGQERSVNSNKSFTNGPSVPTGWDVVLDGQSMQLMLPDSDSTHTLIGPANGSKYTGADSTIAGDAGNNPFLVGAVSFVVSVPGITAATQVEWATFHFGTCAEYIPLCSTPVPEPATVTLVVTALACAMGVGWRRRRTVAAK